MRALTPPFNLPAPGRRQSLYVVFTTLQRPVFLVNSRLGLVCAPSSGSGDRPLYRTEGPLLPKLRGQFAEFLNEGSLTRLRSPSASTCVGFGYGHPLCSLEGFSWCLWLSHFRPYGPVSLLAIPRWAFPHRLAPRLHLFYHSQAGLQRHVPPIAQSPSRWYRTILRFAITYASRPRLSIPTNPGRIRLAQGTLRISANKTLTCFHVTHAGSFTSVHSTGPSNPASPHTERSPTPYGSHRKA